MATMNGEISFMSYPNNCGLYVLTYFPSSNLVAAWSPKQKEDFKLLLKEKCKTQIPFMVTLIEDQVPFSAPLLLENGLVEVFYDKYRNCHGYFSQNKYGY